MTAAVRACRAWLCPAGLVATLTVVSAAWARPGSPAPTAAPASAPAATSPAATASTTTTEPQRGESGWTQARRWLASWRQNRARHRALRLARLRYRLGEALGGEPLGQPLLAELRTHAWRVARLERIKELAIEARDAPALKRVDLLLKRERSRHAAWLQRLAPRRSPPGDAGP